MNCTVINNIITTLLVGVVCTCTTLQYYVMYIMLVLSRSCTTYYATAPYFCYDIIVIITISLIIVINFYYWIKNVNRNCTLNLHTEGGGARGVDTAQIIITSPV